MPKPIHPAHVELSAAELVLFQALDRIHLDPVQSVQADRNSPIALENACMLYVGLQLPVFSYSGPLGQLKVATEEYRSKYALDQSQVLQPLFEDLCMLAHLFAAVSDHDQLKVSLNPVYHDMCRKFHTDINELRMLCTYFGPGTEVIDYHPDDKRLWKAVEEEDMQILSERLKSIPLYSILLMKGALYRGTHPEACLHRSPPISEQSTARLLLRIDAGASFI
jgi:hypothetical protein